MNCLAVSSKRVKRFKGKLNFAEVNKIELAAFMF